MRLKRIGHDSKVGCVLQTHRRDHFPQDRSAFNQKAVNYGSSWNLNGRGYNGTSDYVDAGNNPSLNLGTGAGKQLTISLWYYAKGISTSAQFLIAKREASSLLTDYCIFTEGNVLVWGTGTVTDSGAWMYVSEPSRSTWHNVIVTLNQTGTASGTKSIYINGILGKTSSYAAKGSVTTKTLKIGETGLLGNPFNGSIDEVRIYNRALYHAKMTTGYFRRKPCIGA